MPVEQYARNGETGEVELTAIGEMDSRTGVFVVDEVATMEFVLGELSAEAKRRRAYEAEVDVIRDRAFGYWIERDAWMARGMAEQAKLADAKARAAMADYLDRKEEIRARYPDEP